MTPKEKAKELVEKMFNVDLQCDNEAMCMLYPHAIKCALIAVEEILNELDLQNHLLRDYWYDVQHEIEKL
jgi:hypothetical protein